MNSRTNLTLLTLGLLCAVMNVGMTPSWAAAPESGRATRAGGEQILILAGPNYGVPMLTAITPAIVNTLTDGGVSLTDIYVEFLDLHRTTGDQHRTNVLTLLEHKLRHQRIGLIIAINQGAVDFVAREGEGLFPDAPMIIPILEQFPSWQGSPRRLIAISSRQDARGTLGYALDLFPQTRRVLLIVGGDDHAAPFLEPLREAIADAPIRLEVEDTADLSYEEMLARAGSLPRDAIGLYGSYFRDVTGRSFVPAEVAARIAAVASRPMFAFRDMHIVQGLTGGSVVMTSDLGVQAASAGLDYLAGDLNLVQPVTSLEVGTSPLFDWQQLKRWRGNMRALPPETIFLERPPTLWNQHREAVLVVAASIVFMVVLAAAQLRENRRLKVAIRERELAEHALREKEFLLANSQKIARIGSWQHDLVANVLIWSDETYRIFGLEPQACTATYEKFMNLVHPDDRAAVYETYASSLREGRDSHEIEHRIVRQDTGDIRHVFEKCLHERDAAGSLSRSIGMVQDITERKHAETELREGHKRLESFLQISQGITSSFEQADLMQVIVDHATEVMGIGSGAVYLLADRDSIRLAATTPALPVDFPEGLRLAALNEHAHIREALTSCQPVVMADARTATLTPAEQDIIQVRNLRSNLYLPIRLRGRAIGVLILSSVEKLHTFTEESISLLEGFASQAAQIFDNIRNYEQAKRHAEELEREIAERKQAEQEREHLQAQLNQAQKLESVGRLAGGVAHDFNNMLGVILGRSELALEGIGPDEPLRSVLEEIRQAARRSADLTRQLLTFARKQSISPRLLDLNGTVASMLDLLRRLIGEDIDLAWRPGREVWPVRMDPTQIDQILANLCVNARDAIAGVGRITIETGNTTFDEHDCARIEGLAPGDYALLAVHDDGCGVDPAALPNIFEPFYTTKAIGKGTGLGLASVYGAVKQNNGFVDVHSEPGQGTVFKVYLPRHLAADAEAEAIPEKRAAAGGHETILLVEDEPAILQMSSLMLDRLGYTVVPAQAPGEAIRLATGHPGRIDLLMTDVIMPEMNGLDLARELRSIYPDLRWLFMSGYAADVIEQQAEAGEGLHFIQKPFSKDELAATLRDALGAG